MTSKTSDYDPHDHGLYGFPTDPMRGPRKNLCDGGSVYVLDPKPEDMTIEIIARGLSNLCRFGGQLKRDVWYSVAEHSMLVTSIVMHDMRRPDLALEALLHDADEAILGFDIPTPVKAAFDVLVGPKWRQLPDGIKAAISERWQLRTDPAARAIIKTADRVALSTEKRDFLDPESFPWGELLEPLPQEITSCPRRMAQECMMMIHTAECIKRGVTP